jgi:hypothetical protein
LQQSREQLIGAFGALLDGLLVQGSYLPCTHAFVHTGGRDAPSLGKSLKQLIGAVADPYVDETPSPADLATLSLARAA